VGFSEVGDGRTGAKEFNGGVNQWNHQPLRGVDDDKADPLALDNISSDHLA
jgi:hypothetical protein